MLADLFAREKWFTVASFTVLAATIFLVAFTGNPFLLALPFGYLYAVLVGINWKAAYWIFLFTIPPNCQPGTTLRLRGRGLRHRSGQQGDILIRIQGRIPDQIDPELLDHIRLKHSQ
jgi:hypothetical protein